MITSHQPTTNETNESITPRNNARAWWSDEVQEAVKNRRKCQEEINKNTDPSQTERLRAAYNEATTEARTIINAAKAETMEAFCEKLEANTDPSLVFKTVKKINGEEKFKRPANVPLRKNGKLAKTEKEISA